MGYVKIHVYDTWIKIFSSHVNTKIRGKNAKKMFVFLDFVKPCIFIKLPVYEIVCIILHIMVLNQANKYLALCPD